MQRSAWLMLSLLTALPANAGWILQGAQPEQKLNNSCLVYPGFVVVLEPDEGGSGGEAVSVRPRAKDEELDVARSCGFNDSNSVFKTLPKGSSHFAGMFGNVVLIADEEIRTSLFAYELPSGKELFVARNWSKGEVDVAGKTVSFFVPAHASDCETSLRAQSVSAQVCRKRAEDALACLRKADERFSKVSPKKLDSVQSKKGGGKDCSFDLREKYRFDASKKVLEPTGEVTGEIGSTL
ncbi:MAG: hypothetical protein ACT4TC_11260 [Myxococcaceae bacterium]